MKEIQKTKKKRKVSELARLKKSWIMELTNYLTKLYPGMSFREAKERAEVMWNALELMGEEACYLRFFDETGGYHECVGSLNLRYMMENGFKPKPERKQREKPWPRDWFTFWNCDEQEWNTVRASGLLVCQIWCKWHRAEIVED